MRTGIPTPGFSSALAYYDGLRAERLPAALIQGLRDLFGEHIYSGREHVTRGKPAPDLYLHAAERLGVRIEDCAILEDSPVGATGAVASGGHVIGMCMGTHCAIGHDQRLRDIGVAAIAQDYEDVRRELGF